MARLILIADDSPTIQKRAQGILKSEGFEVETVSNGVAAIKKLPILQPVLVLADVSMPGKDGYEVCEYIKASADFHHVAVLLVASDLEPYDERRGAQVGADGLIKKPFDNHELIAMVERFAPLSESAAPTPTLPDTIMTAAVETPLEAGPSEIEPEGATESHERDWAALSSGVAFVELQPDQVSAAPPGPEPWSEISLQPSPEPVYEAPAESVPGGPSESIFEMPGESLPSPALDLTPEPTPATAESTPEETPEGVSEPGPATSEPVSEAVPEARPEPASVLPQPAGEEGRLSAETVPGPPQALTVDESSLPEGPILVEEPMETVLRPDHALEHAVPNAEATMAFHAPAEILEPVLRDDLAAAPPVPEPQTSIEGQPPGRIAAASLDSFSLADAWEGQVYFAPAEAEPAPEQAPEVVQRAEAPEATPSVIDPQWVYAIVHKAVMKMAPPVLSPEVVEELIRRLTEEITAELNAESSQAQ